MSFTVAAHKCTMYDWCACPWNDFDNWKMNIHCNSWHLKVNGTFYVFVTSWEYLNRSIFNNDFEHQSVNAKQICFWD